MQINASHIVRLAASTVDECIKCSKGWCKANPDSRRLERWVCDGDATVCQNTLVSMLVISFLLLIYKAYLVLTLTSLIVHRVINV